MLSDAELAAINDIKNRVLTKRPVEDWEKQYMLDLAMREQVSVRKAVVQRAKNSGFNVKGIKTF